MLTIYFRAWVTLLCAVCIPITNFSLWANSTWRCYLGWDGACAYFLSQHEVPIWVGPVQDQCKNMCISPVLSTRSYFLSVLHLQWFLQVFHLFFLSLLRHKEERDFMEASHLGLSFPVSLTLCILSSHESLYLSQYTAWRSFFDDGWIGHWPVNLVKCHQVSFYFYSSLVEQYSIFHRPNDLSCLKAQ